MNCLKQGLLSLNPSDYHNACSKSSVITCKPTSSLISHPLGSDLNRGKFCSAGYIWQCLQAFFSVMTGIYWTEVHNDTKHPKMNRTQPTYTRLLTQQSTVQAQMSVVQKWTSSALGPGPLWSMVCQPPVRPCFSQFYRSYRGSLTSFMRGNTIKSKSLHNHLPMWATTNRTQKYNLLIDFVFWSCDFSTSPVLSFLETWSWTSLNQNLFMNRVDMKWYDSKSSETSPFLEMVPNTHRWAPHSCTRLFALAGRHLTQSEPLWIFPGTVSLGNTKAGGLRNWAETFRETAPELVFPETKSPAFSSVL